MSDKRTLWKYAVGLLPTRVVAREHAPANHVVYAFVSGSRKKKSLGITLRDPRGRLIQEHVKRAIEATNNYYLLLVGGETTVTAKSVALTIAEGWTLAIDAQKGKWPHETAHRKEMERAIERVKQTWGARTAWNAIGRGEVRQLWRSVLTSQRAKSNAGVRSAEIVVARVFALANWLREEGHIAETACRPWSAWRIEMANDTGDYTPKRLRHTDAEFVALLHAAPNVDPRFALLFSLGAELRLGQVSRAMRSDLGEALDRLQLRGKGKKRGTLTMLTEGQRAGLVAALETGYLRELESAYRAANVADYPLFPSGRLRKVDGIQTAHASHATWPCVDRSAVRSWFEQCEVLAKITHMPGRGWYGPRRIAVDLAKAAGISREGLQAQGGWSDTQVPDRIYADQKSEAAAVEARNVRAVMRKERHQNDTNAVNAPQPSTSIESATND